MRTRSALSWTSVSVSVAREKPITSACAGKATTSKSAMPNEMLRPDSEPNQVRTMGRAEAEKAPARPAVRGDGLMNK